VKIDYWSVQMPKTEEFAKFIMSVGGIYGYRNTEEGWEARAVNIEKDGDVYRLEWTDKGTDCDGPIETLEDFIGKADEHGNIHWEKVGAAVHDRFAEDMGY
jgi:hypothetical protein